MKKLAPGVALCAAIFAAAFWLSGVVERAIDGFNPFTASVLAIVLGVVVANTFKPGPRYAPGIGYCLKNVLRIAIILIGIRLSLMEVGELGAAGLPIVAIAVATGVLGVELLGRLFKIPHKLALLLGAGTSICGVTAVVSTAPVIDADEGEVAYAVANVTLFGLLGTLLYPYLVPYLFPLGKQCGLFLGTAIHDTAQLMGAAVTYKDLYNEETGFATAAITKMTRNLFLALIIPYYAWRTRDQRSSEVGAKRPPLLPPFLIGFLLMSCLRSLGDYTLNTQGQALGFLSSETWSNLLDLVGKEIGSTWLVGLALVGVGLNLKPEIFKGLGIRPFLLGLSGAVLVGATSFLAIKLLAGV
ncbi:MAG: putative sulfate exporter family transporter [Vulcanimicrobiota bacterium]